MIRSGLMLMLVAVLAAGAGNGTLTRDGEYWV